MKKIICAGCGGEAQRKTWTQKYCAPCSKVSYEKRHKVYRGRWKKKMRVLGAIYPRCDAAVLKRGMCGRCKEYVRVWKINNKGALAVHRANRRAAGEFSRGLVGKLAIKQRNRCAYCAADISKRRHLDHIMPIALGGSNDDSNAQLVCPPCNYRKGAMHPTAFAQRLGLLI